MLCFRWRKKCCRWRCGHPSVTVLCAVRCYTVAAVWHLTWTNTATAFRPTCQVCRTDTLTLEALHLHLRAIHAPRLFPLPATVTADSLVGQALLPTNPYRQGSMSAIASLVSMAGCPLGASGVTAIDSALVANTHAAGIAAWGVKQGVTSHGTDSVLSVTAGTLQHL
ncbi:hypothetical protein BaRGS_00008080 [Batillaria attramentaria]|uniref:C2H2-type domain-containing protein n=1 Tax=Batillaria attramentaria TaxID=370345 RepID=A0ABD0LNH2_9CAEN